MLAAQPDCDNRGKTADDKPSASIITHFFSTSAGLAEKVFHVRIRLMNGIRQCGAVAGF